jgi:Response regulator containing a CheY-like receiver domain and an HTH DNA-binding domain
MNQLQFDEQRLLTSREFEVVSLIVFNGYSNKELADRLCISEKTVKNHVANIFRKMNITSVRKLMSICMSSMLAEGGCSSESAELRRVRLAHALDSRIKQIS